MTCWMSMATKIEKSVKPQRMKTAHCWSVQVGALLQPACLTVSALVLAGEAAVLLVLAVVESCVLGLKVPTS